MAAFDPQSYGPCFAALLDGDRLNSLAPDKPNRRAEPSLEAMTLESAFGHAPVRDTEMAMCCLSAVWLLHDYLDRSHSISQGVATPCGSYWHAIMHRREGDFSNAKYWLRRTGDHPIYPSLWEWSRDFASGADLDISAGFLTTQSAWRPDAFVDLCEKALRGRSHMEDACRRIAQQEWRLLFDYCYRGAVGQ